MDLARRLARMIALLPTCILLTCAACGGSTSSIGGDGGPGPNPACPTPTVVGAGGGCLDDGLSCPGIVTFSECGGSSTATTQCTCNDNSWSCPIAFAGACPAPLPCPAPSSVTPGGACGTDPSLSCQSNIPLENCNGQTPYGVLSCNCESGAWSCAQGAPACPLTCPPAGSTYAGSGCDIYGTTCNGDPQSCGGFTVYDDLECQAGVWQVVAATTCFLDGGTDAEGPDAGVGF